MPVLRYASSDLPLRRARRDWFTWLGAVLVVLIGTLLAGMFLIFSLFPDAGVGMPGVLMGGIIGFLLLIFEGLSILGRSPVAAGLVCGGILFMMIGQVMELFSTHDAEEAVFVFVVCLMMAIAVASHVRWAIQLWRHRQRG